MPSGVYKRSTVLKEELLNAESCWALLERIAASKQLRHAVRLKEILFYVGKRSLKDGCDRVREQEIGSYVFHRPASYDTSADNIVRTNVSDLRKRIEAYFSSEGSHELLVMEIPRGGYVPVFRARTVEPEPPEETFTEIQPRAIEVPSQTPEAHAYPARFPSAQVGAGLLILVLSIACFYFWSQYRALHRSLFAWQEKPTVAEFWSQMLSSNPNTDVVLSDTGIGIVQALSKKTFPLNDYLNHSYVSQLEAGDMSPEMHTATDRILAWNLASPDEFMLARRILALDPLGRYMHLYNARNYVPDLVTRDNVILIGGSKSNPWDELFEKRMNFVTEFDSPRVINRAPAAGEQAVYLPSNADGYCVVAYLRKSENSGQVLMIEGTNAEATEAAGNFLLSEDQLSNFKKMLRVNTLPSFQVLLKVSSVRGTPLAATVVAYRASSGSGKTATE